MFAIKQDWYFTFNGVMRVTVLVGKETIMSGYSFIVS